jgi:hypothetical protein
MAHPSEAERILSMDARYQAARRLGANNGAGYGFARHHLDVAPRLFEQAIRMLVIAVCFFVFVGACYGIREVLDHRQDAEMAVRP